MYLKSEFFFILATEECRKQKFHTICFFRIVITQGWSFAF